MRKKIRTAAHSTLDRRADLIRVEIGRRHPVDAADLPAALIYTDSEDQERGGMKKRHHAVDLKVSLYVKPDGQTAGEDDVDDLIEKIDPLLVASVAAVSGVYDVYPTGLDIDGDGEADADYLLATRTYAVEYESTEV